MPAIVVPGWGVPARASGAPTGVISAVRGLIPPVRHQPMGPALTPADSDKMQAALADFARQFLDCPFLTGRMITGIEMAASSSKEIVHGLGRQPIGWWPVDIYNALEDKGDPGSLYRRDWNDKTLTLYWFSDAIATIAIWVF